MNFDRTLDLVKDYDPQISDCIALVTSTKNLLDINLNIDLLESAEKERCLKPLREDCAHLIAAVNQMKMEQNQNFRKINLIRLGSTESNLNRIQIKYNSAVKKNQLKIAINSLQNKIIETLHSMETLWTKVQRERTQLNTSKTYCSIS